MSTQILNITDLGKALENKRLIDSNFKVPPIKFLAVGSGRPPENPQQRQLTSLVDAEHLLCPIKLFKTLENKNGVATTLELHAEIPPKYEKWIREVGIVLGYADTPVEDLQLFAYGAFESDTPDGGDVYKSAHFSLSFITLLTREDVGHIEVEYSAIDQNKLVKEVKEEVKKSLDLNMQDYWLALLLNISGQNKDLIHMQANMSYQKLVNYEKLGAN